ncbi:MAG: phosphate acetyltransferase [Bacteroidales bacterium]|nr:phosphate acetyltransferase [Bacteroidales bacterium]
MSKNLYISAAEAESGKSLIVLGIMSLLTRHIKKVGFFRPIIRLSEEKDNDIELVSKRFNLPLEYSSMYGTNNDEAFDMIHAGDMDRLFTAILDKYKKLEAKCDFILVEGTDYSDSLKLFEFDFNAHMANNLGAPVLAVVNGKSKSVADISDMVQLIKRVLHSEKCSYLGMIVNRVERDFVNETKKLLKKFKTGNEIDFVIPELDLLQKLTIRQISNTLKADLIYGDDNVLDYDVDNFKVGAMSIENILKNTETGTLVITPGDRTDVLISLFMTLLSKNHPKIAGILLTGGYKPDKEFMKLIGGINKLPVAICRVNTDTYSTTLNVNKIKAILAPNNERKMAMALGHFETFVSDSILKVIIDVTPSDMLTPIMFEYELFERARSKRKHIVLPEGLDDRILRSTEILLSRNVVDITLLGNEDEIYKRAAELHLKLDGANIIDPYDNDLINDYAATYFRLRKHKGISKEMAFDTMRDVSYLGTMMVYKGHADGMVSGAAHTTQHTIRPAFEFIKTKPGFSIVSSCFLMCFEDRVLAYADCAFNPNPDAEQLADIAISSADTATLFGIEARVAMLSYSTGVSGKGKDVEKVKLATDIARKRRPDLKIEGPIQYDAAIDATVARKKMPDSEVAGKATVFIFPDLNTGNNTYKAVQRAANAVAVGPVSQGLNKPVNDLSRGCLVKDIVNTVLITAIQAQQDDLKK